MTLKYTGNIACPFCNNTNKDVKIPEMMWLMRYDCPYCKNTITGCENSHAWTWIFCSYGDAPWILIQEKEKRRNK